ncbi:MOSC domain-containing protein [Deinococcus apachensis]|uniref:MOSC domain-containing protein n=1 Tax=Deinococcus apachensis TaxID=309886 RepID=UPI00037614D0|nr:MOSC domain-containing protein [Deinococcus apachensis]
MRLLSVNVGQPTAVRIGNNTVVTGICKQPVTGRVRVTEEGLDGDRVMNRKHHGGPDQAVYLYTREDYDHWEGALGKALTPGTLGENLLVAGLESANVPIGERFRVGDVLLEVTACRIPCATLGARMGDPGFVKHFAAARRPGLYTRVLAGGEIGSEDAVTREPGPAGAPTVGEVFDLWFSDAPPRETLERYLTYPLGIRLRRAVEELLDGR